MVSINQFKTLLVLVLVSLLASCLSSSPKPDRPETTSDNIYEAINNDVIIYREEEQIIQKGSPEYIENGIRDLRKMYQDGDYNEAKDLCNKLLKLNPGLSEVYYWLARIHLDEADFQSANNMATKGLNYAEKEGMIRELEWLQRQSQMGAN